MSPREVTPREALTRLGASTAEAVAQVLDTFAPGVVERGEVSVLPNGVTPFSDLPFGAFAASVSYVNGVSGANIFLMTPAGARTLAGAMGAPPPESASQQSAADSEQQPAAEGDAAGAEMTVSEPPPRVLELSDLECSAVAEAANQMMAAAASAISVVLGQEVEISPPDTRVLDDTDSAIDIFGTSAHATSTTFTIDGEPCRLIQLVPSAFVVRMARAIDELSVEQAGPGDAGQSLARVDAHSVGLREALNEIKLRVWAELGRARLPLGKALTLPLGTVVDLDRAADAPVDLFVNGLRFAQGHLLVTDDGEWAVCLDEVTDRRVGGPDATAPPRTRLEQRADT